MEPIVDVTINFRPSHPDHEETRLWRTALIAAFVCLSVEAQAYPQYIGKTYTNCGTCHYSPTGGGLVNSYEIATLDANDSKRS
jgi:hypothetical protein